MPTSAAVPTPTPEPPIVVIVNVPSPAPLPTPFVNVLAPDPWAWSLDSLLALIVAITTTLVALAALTVTYFSWQTAKKANDMTTQHRKEDRDASQSRFRRGIAVSMRDWLSSSAWRAKFGVYYESGDPEGERLWKLKKKLTAQLEREGEVNGLRLINHLSRELSTINFSTQKMTSKELAQARHPSRMNVETDRLIPLIDSWSGDPASIDDPLRLEESGEAQKAQARASALRQVIDEHQAKMEARENDATTAEETESDG